MEPHCVPFSRIRHLVCQLQLLALDRSQVHKLQLMMQKWAYDDHNGVEEQPRSDSEVVHKQYLVLYKGYSALCSN